MSVVISGALIDGAGIPMSGCHIILKSRVNTSEVVVRTVADVVTGNCGEYCFKAQTGKYCVYLKQDWRDEYCVGDIAVYDDSKPGTLNNFLTALDEGDLKPDVVKRFEEMVAQAQQSAEAAAESERQAGQHVADAQQIKSDCETLADNVQQNAEAVAEDKNQVALLASSATQDAARAEQAVKDADAIVQKAVDKLADAATLTGEAKASAEAAAKSEQNAKSHADNAAGSAQQTAQDVTATETARDDAERFAENARQDAVATAEDRKATAEDVKSTGANAAAAGQSAQDAAGYAHAAEQAKTDIDITLAGTLKTVNHLSEIAAAGTEAQQESRDNLGLKSAATMEPQNDTHDRTPGRLAVPGMFGFGKIFSSTEALTFNGQADFAEWLKEVMPERYAVSIADSSALLPGTTKFNGIIDVMWSPFENDESDATRKFKTLMFYNQYYEGEHSIHRLTYRCSGNHWNATVSPIIYDGDSLAFLLSRTAGNGPSSYYKYPAVGSLLLAVYQGTAAGDKAIKIGQGDIVPGSRLGPVTITCSINDAGTYVSTPRVSAGGAGAFSFPGRYQALSGFSNSYGDEGRICLFVRIE
ncbi:prophage tail fiber N-terminal domain-containing protein [Escherichia coli]|nr:prophage tail fiber N-terminal domain-containing protein [Escherichia coli]HBV8845972.1 prophage tail fiber N-terminal domain-containing protein [Escherichia coli]